MVGGSKVVSLSSNGKIAVKACICNFVYLWNKEGVRSSSSWYDLLVEGLGTCRCVRAFLESG